MVHNIARALQLAGLVIVPVAIAGNVADERLSLKESLIMSSIGITIFFLGWLLQKSKSQE